MIFCKLEKCNEKALKWFSLKKSYKAFIKNLYIIKGYGLRRRMREFPGKGWKWSGLDKFLTKLWNGDN